MSDPKAPDYPEHLLPDNSNAVERALSASDHRTLSAPHWLIRAVWSPDDCPAHLLPYLAAAWSVDEWDPEWSESTKRRVIRESPDIHRVKGTKGAIRRAVEALGMGALIEEWFDYGGAPYSFRMSVRLEATAVWTSRQAGTLWRTALNTKNVRSWLEKIALIRPMPEPAPLGIGIATRARIKLRISFEPLSRITPPAAGVFCGVVPVTRTRMRFGV